MDSYLNPSLHIATDKLIVIKPFSLLHELNEWMNLHMEWMQGVECVVANLYLVCVRGLVTIKRTQKEQINEEVFTSITI